MLRLTWLAFTIVLLDQAVKLLIQFSGLGKGASLVIGPISAELKQSPSLSEATLYANLANSTTLVMIAGLAASFFLLFRWRRQFHFVTGKTLTGLQLAAGSIASTVIDNVLRGGMESTLRLEFFETFTFNAGIADLALFIGLALLLYVLLQGKSKLQSHYPLLYPSLEVIDFSRVPRGVDNIHIDVLLSPEFRRKAGLLVHRLVNLVITHHRQGKGSLKLPKNFFGAIQGDFNALMSLALRKAKDSGEKQLPDLLFIAILKFLHDEVSNRIAATIKFTKENVNEHHKRGLGRRNDSTYVEWLFRHRDTLISTTNLTLLQGLTASTHATLAKTFRSFLGVENTFSLQAMQTPMLLAESPHNDHLQMEHYLILGQLQNDQNSFVRLDKVLGDIFADYLSLMREKADGESHRPPLHTDGYINSNIIDSLSQPSVLMHPFNITILLDTGWTLAKLRKANRVTNWKRYRLLKHHLGFQSKLQEHLHEFLYKEGYATWINAAYKARDILHRGHSDLSPAALTALLARSSRREELIQRMVDLFRTAVTPPAREHVIQAWEEIQRHSDRLLQQNLLRFISDFARYRRDLLLLLSYQRAASQLNLLASSKDIQTSRANFTLYEFQLSSEITRSETAILSHIIIKADLRGSTEVTQKLTELSLNPATHFDRNFFAPINEVIENYGAEKLFIEGDAIILALNEYAGDSQDTMIASRACGLAAKILQIVAKQNRELVVYGLPVLELGIGIAYCGHTPHYLFDGQNRITISPAINVADRLSACAHGVREWREGQHAPAEYVEVYQPSANARSKGEKAQKDMVFNINGILLEEAVTERLKQELTLHPVKNTLAAIQQSRLYSIVFPDLSGESHSLIIRKAPVREFDPEYPVDQCPLVEGRFFHEVIYRQELLDQLKKRH
jgi:lipoprotein signal peptidase